MPREIGFVKPSPLRPDADVRVTSLSCWRARGPPRREQAFHVADLCSPSRSGIEPPPDALCHGLGAALLAMPRVPRRTPPAPILQMQARPPRSAPPLPLSSTSPLA